MSKGSPNETWSESDKPATSSPEDSPQDMPPSDELFRLTRESSSFNNLSSESIQPTPTTQMSSTSKTKSKHSFIRDKTMDLNPAGYSFWKEKMKGEQMLPPPDFSPYSPSSFSPSSSITEAYATREEKGEHGEHGERGYRGERGFKGINDIN